MKKTQLFYFGLNCVNSVAKGIWQVLSTIFGTFHLQPNTEHQKYVFNSITCDQIRGRVNFKIENYLGEFSPKPRPPPYLGEF